MIFQPQIPGDLMAIYVPLMSRFLLHMRITYKTLTAFPNTSLGMNWMYSTQTGHKRFILLFLVIW